MFSAMAVLHIHHDTLGPDANTARITIVSVDISEDEPSTME